MNTASLLPNAELAAKIDWRHLDQAEIKSKVVRELYAIFYLNNNEPLTDVEIFDTAKGLGFSGYAGVTKDGITRGHIFKWNHLHDVKDATGKIVSSVLRIQHDEKKNGEKKGRYRLVDSFAEKVFGKHHRQQVHKKGAMRFAPYARPENPTRQIQPSSNKNDESSNAEFRLELPPTSIDVVAEDTDTATKDTGVKNVADTWMTNVDIGTNDYAGLSETDPLFKALCSDNAFFDQLSCPSVPDAPPATPQATPQGSSELGMTNVLFDSLMGSTISDTAYTAVADTRSIQETDVFSSLGQTKHDGTVGTYGINGTDWLGSSGQLIGGRSLQRFGGMNLLGLIQQQALISLLLAQSTLSMLPIVSSGPLINPLLSPTPSLLNPQLTQSNEVNDSVHSELLRMLRESTD